MEKSAKEILLNIVKKTENIDRKACLEEQLRCQEQHREEYYELCEELKRLFDPKDKPDDQEIQHYYDISQKVRIIDMMAGGFFGFEETELNFYHYQRNLIHKFKFAEDYFFKFNNVISGGLVMNF
jgi:hypothetical protein